MQRTALVLFPGCVYQEVAAAVAMSSERFPLLVMSPDGLPVRTREGLTLAAEARFDDAKLETLRCLLVPGGDIRAVLDNAALDTLLASAARAPWIAIGGICNGVVLLAKAGVLDGRACTHTCTQRFASAPEFEPLLAFAAPHFARTRYVDRDVVQEGAIVTARPWGASRFAERLAMLTGAATPVQAARRADYLRDVYWGREDNAFVRHVIRLRPVAGKTAALDVIRAHVRYLRALDTEGRLVSCGPFRDGSGGMVIIRAHDLVDAQATAARDPFVVDGSRTAEVTPWEISCDANRHQGMSDEADDVHPLPVREN